VGDETKKKLRYTITISNTGERYECIEGQHLLLGMVKLGRKGIPSGCHGGGCGVCKIYVESGEYRKLPLSRKHVSSEEEKQGYSLACRTIAESDIHLRAVGKFRKAVTKSYGFV
jgi:Na+-transporting NADH:ubiquinone oxidoreductase subunit NqrF